MKYLMFTLIAMTTIISTFSACKKEESCTLLKWHQDFDNDGKGNPAIFLWSCTKPEGFVLDSTDTDDDCTSQTWYEDLDEDGKGNPAVPKEACTQPEGYVLDDTDTDDNCTLQTWYQDTDGDGLGNSAVTKEACTQPEGYVLDDTDTNDNCTLQTWYQDADGDGLGNPAVSIESCNQTTGYVSNANDTDDTTAESSDCSSMVPTINRSRGECTEWSNLSRSFGQSTNGTTRVITSSSVPSHKIGLFGSQQEALGPHAIQEQNSHYSISDKPTVNNNFTPLLDTETGPQYVFGVLLNGIELDPILSKPWPNADNLTGTVNWEWNQEALNANFGYDCNNADVQVNGKYRYHGMPTLYIDNLEIDGSAMKMIGYAADGFPIYYKYAYTDAEDSNSSIIAMTSGYQLKTGERPGDGSTDPCGTYNGVYSNDFEYIQALGTLDKANGRTGVTPQFPNGTYYYVLTDQFPSIPRYFKGSPSQSFRKEL